MNDMGSRSYPSGLELVPLTLREARSFVQQFHRHHAAPAGGLFAIGAARDDQVVGVAIVGRPVARLTGPWTVEVTRLCTDGSKNVCSFLYAACWRAARAMGFRRLITYTLASEPGTSLRAAGWELIASTRAQSWNRPSRPRVDHAPAQAKLRWEVASAIGK